LWEIDASGHQYSQGLCSDDYPGEFFIICDNDLLRMNALDGSVVQRYPNLPPGSLRLWAKPFEGARDALVVVNADTVSYYGFGVITDVPEPTGNAQMPTSFVLDQPYPNPFNAELTVPIEVRERGHLRVDVYNSLGQKVATLLDGEVGAGPLLLRWNAWADSSGVYMIRGSFNGQSSAVKAVLLK